MLTTRVIGLCILCLFASGVGVVRQAQAGTPIRAAAYVAELASERLYRVDFHWGGAGQLSVGTLQLITMTSATWCIGLSRE